MNGKLENVENEVQELRAELEAARARTAEYETALQDLDRQQSAAAGRLELARRQAAEYSARLETRESELAEARRREETYDAFRAVVERRDVAGLEAAGAIDTALDRLAAFGRLQAAIPAAREEVAPGYDVSVRAEPEELEQAWERLVAVVRERIDERLEDEIVDAAAHSVAGHGIGKLPEHLQALARRRRQQFLASAGAANKERRAR